MRTAARVAALFVGGFVFGVYLVTLYGIGGAW